MSRSSNPESRTPNPALLVEIGCEEIPARFLAQAQKDFGEKLQGALEDYSLLPPCSGGVPTAEVSRESEEGSSPSPVVAAMRTSPLQTYSTPRRLVAYVPEVLAKQADKAEEVTGPPVRVAFDAVGKPTRAAESFAEKNQARVTDLVRVKTPKGEYLAVKKTTRGRGALELLSEILPAVITGLSFPKSMYWTAKSGPRFVRPIRWILALLGEGKKARVIPFEITGVKSGNATYGHRSLGQRAIRVQGFNDYAKMLRQSHVEFDPSRRHEEVSREIKVLLEDLRLKVIEDKDLEDWIVNSTEQPTPIIGHFDILYQALPREILITVMRDHQKYFAIENEHRVLQSRFIAVLNSEVDTTGTIRRGHERVLKARFADALFFWNSDQKIPLRERITMLERVTYQSKLGSYADKVQRMTKIAKELCGMFEKQERLTISQVKHVLSAVELCKCDLTTQMVQEFPELEGVVGGLYAHEGRAPGEPDEIADAIYDHYRPRGLEDSCPRSVVGALVSLADKIDSVVGGFTLGNAPTGSSDPFGVRRAGNGIIKILLELELPMEIRAILRTAFSSISTTWSLDSLECVVKFLTERLSYYLEAVRGMRHDSVRAVLGPRWGNPLEVLRCAEDFDEVRDSDDFVAIAVAAKRIKNILSKSASPSDLQNLETLDPRTLSEEPEQRLWEAYVSVSEAVSNGRQSRNYRAAFKAMATLRPTVDQFFDKVLVMAPDQTLRRRRLQLLELIDGVLSSLVHVSEIAPDSSNVDAST